MAFKIGDRLIRINDNFNDEHHYLGKIITVVRLKRTLGDGMVVDEDGVSHKETSMDYIGGTDYQEEEL